MATKAPTATQMMFRFIHWMDRYYPDFEYTSAKAEKLLRDFRMGRVTLPSDLEAHLTRPPQAPVKKTARKISHAKFPAKAIQVFSAKKRSPPPPPPPPAPSTMRSSRDIVAEKIARLEAERREFGETQMPPMMARAGDTAAHFDAAGDRPDYSDDDVPFMDDWGDYGDIDMDVEEFDS